MAEEDDLGSFFAEISQIPIETVIEDPNLPYSAESDIKAVLPHDDAISPIYHQAPPMLVVHAAPQLSKASSSHVVYTYDVDVQSQDGAMVAPPPSSDWTGQSASNVPPPPPPAGTNNTSLSSFTFSYQTSTSSSSNIPKEPKTFVRTGGGDVWVDETLCEWPENDFRIFVGDLGKEVNTDMLIKAFQHFKSFAKAKVVKSKVENKGRGYGFVSFLDPMDCAKAIREMNNKYLGTRPMKIRKSTWKDRDIEEVKVKETKRRKVKESLGLA